MKIIAIKGGLGNQLFQYAYGRNLELSGEKIVFDISFFDRNKAKIDTARNFKLNNFNLGTKAGFVNKKRPVLNIFKKIKRNLGFGQGDFYQSEKYFNNITDIIRQDFKLRRKMNNVAEIVFDVIQKEKISVSIHVRRGDYVQDAKTNEYHGVCAQYYYEKALATIAEKLQEKDLEKIHLFIFSDDIEWVKNNLSFPYPITFVSNPAIPDYEELILMSKCAHHIIANSSFSWWGAWLNSNPQKVVIAPAKWFNGKPSTYKDIVPDSWIKI
jgi:hypothetical protein